MNWYLIIGVTVVCWLFLYFIKKYTKNKEENVKKD